MTGLILFLLDKLATVFQAMGADYGQLRAIVQVKLMMDGRRSTTTLGQYGKKSAESNTNFIRMLALYAFVGGVLSVGMLGHADKDKLFAPLTFQFAYIMSLCSMTLISDFSSVMLDSADNLIILPRPVSSRTLWLARVIHITSYLLAIALSLSVGAVFVMASRFGPVAGFVFLGLSLLSAVLMVFLTNVVYLVLMRFVSEEKLREVINYFQIILAILFYGGYQLLPQLMGSDALLDKALMHQWWHYLVPPMWMAGAADGVVQLVFDQTHLLFTALAVIMPFGGLWVMSRFLTTNFTRQLGSIDQDSRPTNPVSVTQSRSGWVERLAGWCTSNTLERAAFAFAWRITGRDRKFKLKTYPQLGFGLAYTAIMSFQTGRASSFFYLFALYFAGLFVMVSQYQLSVSDNYRAAWVYGSTPIATPGNLLVGSLKALIIKLLTPFYLLLSAYMLYRFGTDKLGDVLLGFSNSLLMLVSSALLSTRFMPFSVEQDAVNRSNTSRSLLLTLVLGAVGGVHYGLALVPYGVWAALPVSAGVFWYLLRQYKQTTWSQVEMG